MKNLQKNREFIVKIEGYNSEGLGVARLDGRAIFIPDTLEGEVWHIKLLKVTETAIYAKGLEKQQSSEGRAAPECPYFRKCGGCDTWHMSYEEELRFKLRKVNDALRHIGKQSVTASEIIGCDDPHRYRNKGIFNVGLVDGKIRYGFYRQRTHELFPIDHCLIQMPAGERVAEAVCSFMELRQIMPYDEETGKGTVRHIFVRSAVYTDDTVACIIVARGFGSFTGELVEFLKERCPELTGIVLCINKERYNTILKGDFHTLYGKAELTDYLGRNEFEISPQSFYQINPPQAEKLYSKAVEYACRGGRDSVLELYCGAGTISMFLAERFRTVRASEIVPEAIENAKGNAARNHLENIEFLCGDAGQIAEMYAKEGIKPDCIVVDPPRKGMDETAIRSVASICPPDIVYVSCNPATLARDILRFNSLGYELKDACAVDMFPRTCHVETVCCLYHQKKDFISVPYEPKDADYLKQQK